MLAFDYIPKEFAPVIGAIIGSFLAFTLTYFKERKRNSNRLKVNCRILLEEVNRHLYWFTECLESNVIYLLKDESFDEWERCKYEFCDLDFAEFEILLNHFEKMKSIQFAFNKIASHNPVAIPPELKGPATEYAKQAHALLYRHCYPKKQQS